MGKKDKKKGKGAEKTAQKTEKKQSQKLKKELATKGEDEIEVLLAKFAEEDKKKLQVVEELSTAPSRRSAFSFTAHPDKDQLILFGGEYFNGAKTFVYNDLFLYDIKKDKWLKVSGPGAPPPRCAHQAVAVSQGGGQLWVFGGEFTSPSQSQFYHYKDLWVYHLSSKRWEKISAPNGPSSRSGHRMVTLKKQLIVFGGFHDNVRDYKYYNDVYSFNLETYTWNNLVVSGTGPSPRSACQMSFNAEGKIIIFGGYSKEKVKKDLDHGVTHSDMFLLSPEKHDTTGLKWKWQILKQHGSRPSARCSFAMTQTAADKAILFGGVDDDEKDEELQGSFFNDIYSLDLDKNTWHEVFVTGKKETADKKKRRKRKDGEDEDDEEDEEQEEDDTDTKMSAMNIDEPKVVSDDGVFKLTVGPAPVNPLMAAAAHSSGDGSATTAFAPPPRIGAGLTARRGTLFVYGGLYEDGDKQLTLNDFYSLDLHKLEEWKTIIPLDAKDLEWFDSDSEDDDDDDDDEDEEEEEEDMDTD